jgi:hypothetical protein
MADPTLSPAVRAVWEAFVALTDDDRVAFAELFLKCLQPNPRLALDHGLRMSPEQLVWFMHELFRQRQEVPTELADFRKTFFEAMVKLAVHQGEHSFEPKIRADYQDQLTAFINRRNRKDDADVSQAVQAAAELRSEKNLSWTETARQLHRDRPELFRGLPAEPQDAEWYKRLGASLRQADRRRKKS